MPPDINRFIALAMVGYRQGKMQPITMSSGASGELYRTLAQRVIQARLSEAGHQQYVVARDLSRKGVELATQSHQAAAREVFDQAAAYLREQVDSEEVRLLGQSWLEQGAAYLEARLKQWGRVRDRLQAAMAADTRLEERYDYTIFHMGRVNLVHLLLRAEARAGNAALAIDLAQQVVEYVLGQREALAFGQGWSNERLEQTPMALRHAMLARIASEVGTVLALQPLETAKTLWQRFPGWQQFDGHSLLAEIYDWGQVKQAFLRGQTNVFLSRCAPFLQRGRRETTLWYASVLDLCHCCETMRPVSTRLFQLEVAEDAEHWQELPAPLLPPLLRATLMRTRHEVSQGQSYRHHTPKRRFRAYNVGLPRTGTSSMYSLFGHYRSGNEFMERETVMQIVDWQDKKLSDAAFRAYILRRDQEGGLEMDASSFNHFYLDILAEEFPQAKFIFTIREPYTWMNSYLKLLLRWRQSLTARSTILPQWTTDYGRILFGTFTWETFASSDRLRQSLPELVDGFVRHWAEANRRIFALLPADRSLVVRTPELSSQQGAIARFIGIPRETLTTDHHTNASPDNSDLLADLVPSVFAERCALYASDVLHMMDTV